MLIYTLDLDNVTEGVTVESFKVPSRIHPLTGVKVGNFSQRPGETAAPTPKIFTIRDAEVGSTVTHVKAVLKSYFATGKTERLIGAQSIDADTDSDREQALVYIKADDPEARVKMPDSKELYLEGRLFEGIIRSVIERTNRFGRTYCNCSRPSVLLADKDVEYTLQYSKGSAAFVKTFKFDGEKLVVVSDTKKESKRPRKEIKVLDSKFTDIAADNRQRNRKKNTDEKSRKESRWQ